MKIILCRKGFDSTNGGYPSPILPDGTLMSLPIPSEGDIIKFSELRFDEKHSYYDIMKKLKANIKTSNNLIKLTKNTECHLDPDLSHNIIQRKNNWRGIFGQIKQAQTHLKNRGIKEDDLFLYFGWFKQTIMKNKKLIFKRKVLDLHLLFGFLQIDKIYQVDEKIKLPIWMNYHPHVINEERKKNPTNTIYIARKTLSWDNKTPSFGIFKFNQDLILTKKGYSRSKWQLPHFFRKVNISYHSNDSWKDEVYFQSVGRGQEFVVEDNDDVENWARSLIKHNI